MNKVEFEKQDWAKMKKGLKLKMLFFNRGKPNSNMSYQCCNVVFSKNYIHYKLYECNFATMHIQILHSFKNIHIGNKKELKIIAILKCDVSWLYGSYCNWFP